eukprot:14479353-Alexandrium_andersonii.AAC.1
MPEARVPPKLLAASEGSCPSMPEARVPPMLLASEGSCSLDAGGPCSSEAASEGSCSLDARGSCSSEACLLYTSDAADDM